MRKGASSELAEARCPRDDRAHLVSSDFVAAEPEKFTCDRLNVGNAETETNQSTTDGHQAATHQPGQSTARARRCNHSFRTWYAVNQCLNLLRRSLVPKKIEHDADGFFGHSSLDAGLCSQLTNQFVHFAPPSSIRSPKTGLRTSGYLDHTVGEIQARTMMPGRIKSR